MQFWDKNHTRYQLVKTEPGEKMFNWLFFPGGPGGDSAYFRDLIALMPYPGNYWLVDLPGNGSNTEAIDLDTYDYSQWLTLIVESVQQFTHPVYVGHSYGGMFSLVLPELERYLSALIILNSTPTLWLDAAAEAAKNNNLPDLTDAMQAYMTQPNQENFNAALSACMPYYFTPKNLAIGSAMLGKIAFPFQASAWGLNWAVENNFNATWIPQQLPTLIMGADFDNIVPFHLFTDDPRFMRDNITLVEITDAGHLPWFEQPKQTKQTLDNFVNKNLLFSTSPC